MVEGDLHLHQAGASLRTLEVEIGVKVSGSAAAPTRPAADTISGGETPGREVNHLVASANSHAFGVKNMA